MALQVDKTIKSRHCMRNLIHEKTIMPDTTSEDKLFIFDRWTQLISLLNPNSVTSVDDLSESLSVSKATIRRDLVELHNSGQIRRVRGGAIALPDGSTAKDPIGLMGQALFDDSSQSNSKAKRKIGKKAADLLTQGEAIIIDGGSTTLELAKNICNIPLTVLTTSIPILYALLGQEKLRVLITGGEVFRKQNIVLNPYGDALVSNYAASKVFIGAQAISQHGLLQTDPLLVQNEKDLIARAEEVIVLADSSKFTTLGSLAVCKLSEISTVISDSKISDANRKMLVDAGVKVIIAG